MSILAFGIWYLILLPPLVLSVKIVFGKASQKNRFTSLLFKLLIIVYCAIPLIDGAQGIWKLRENCNKDGGANYYGKISEKSYYKDRVATFSRGEKLLRKMNWDYVEFPISRTDDGYAKFSWNGEEVVETKTDRVSAKYASGWSYNVYFSNWLTSGRSSADVYYVFDRSSNFRVYEYKEYFYTHFIDRIYRAYYGNSDFSCKDLAALGLVSSNRDLTGSSQFMYGFLEGAEYELY